MHQRSSIIASLLIINAIFLASQVPIASEDVREITRISLGKITAEGVREITRNSLGENNFLLPIAENLPGFKPPCPKRPPSPPRRRRSRSFRSHAPFAPHATVASSHVANCAPVTAAFAAPVFLRPPMFILAYKPRFTFD